MEQETIIVIEDDGEGDSPHEEPETEAPITGEDRKDIKAEEPALPSPVLVGTVTSTISETDDKQMITPTCKQCIEFPKEEEQREIVVRKQLDDEEKALVRPKGRKASPLGTAKSLRKKPRYDPLSDDYTSSDLNYCICTVNYPRSLLTTTQMKTVMDDLLELIQDQQRSDDLKPKFNGCFIKPGYISLQCDDMETVRFLFWAGSLLHVDGKPIKVMKESALPYRSKVIAYLSNAAKYDTSRIMRLLNGQNKLRFDQWIVLKRVDRRTNAMLVWAVDTASAERLKFLGSKLAFMFTNIPVMIKSDNPAKDRILQYF